MKGLQWHHALARRVVTRRALNRGAIACALAALMSLPVGDGRARADSGYRLGPGDRIKVTVFGHEDLSGEFEIDATGSVSLPLVQAVPAQGRTPAELEKEITARLEPEYLRNPKVSVEVMTYRPFYIYGEVMRPGSYPYVNGMTVYNAIALAGGFSYRARTSSVRLRRAEGDKTAADVPLETEVRPGDVIEVRERYF